MAKDVQFYDDVYYKGSMTDEQCAYLRELSEGRIAVVPGLTRCIRDLPKPEIETVKKEAAAYLAAHGTYAGYTRDRKNDRIGTLRDEQTVGVAFMYYAMSSLLGDSVGMGKTVQLAGLINILEREYRKAGKSFRFCFLTKKTAVDQIRDKLIQFTGNFVDILPDGGEVEVTKWIERSKKGAVSVAGTHSLLQSGDFVIEVNKKPFDLIIFDEGTGLKNRTSTMYKNFKLLAKKHNRIIILNATPFEMHLNDFYNQLSLLDPYYMPNVGDFEREFVTKPYYGVRQARSKVTYKNTEKLRRAVSLKYIARTRDTVGALYEDNKFQSFIVENSPIQKKLLRDSSMYALVGDYPTGVDRDVVYDEDTTPKLAALNYILNELIQPHVNQCLVYCKWKECQKEMLEFVEMWGYRAVIVNGETSRKKRTDIIDGMNERRYDVLITNIKEAIDLKMCDNTVIYSIDTNPKALEQVEGRMLRELDIVGKRLFLLIAAGKEKRFVDKHMRTRVLDSDKFTATSRSLVTDALRDRDGRVVFKTSVDEEEDDIKITLMSEEEAKDAKG